jgi:hypothetical protein
VVFKAEKVKSSKEAEGLPVDFQSKPRRNKK